MSASWPCSMSDLPSVNGIVNTSGRVSPASIAANVGPVQSYSWATMSMSGLASSNWVTWASNAWNASSESPGRRLTTSRMSLSWALAGRPGRARHADGRGGRESDRRAASLVLRCCHRLLCSCHGRVSARSVLRVPAVADRSMPPHLIQRPLPRASGGRGGRSHAVASGGSRPSVQRVAGEQRARRPRAATRAPSEGW